MNELIKTILYYGMIFIAFMLSWKLSFKIKAINQIMMGLVVSVLLSGIILFLGGVVWFITEPDRIGKIIVVFIYIMAIIVINVIVLTSLIFYKKD